MHNHKKNLLKVQWRDKNVSQQLYYLWSRQLVWTKLHRSVSMSPFMNMCVCFFLIYIIVSPMTYDLANLKCSGRSIGVGLESNRDQSHLSKWVLPLSGSNSQRIQHLPLGFRLWYMIISSIQKYIIFLDGWRIGMAICGFVRLTNSIFHWAITVMLILSKDSVMRSKFLDGKFCGGLMEQCVECSAS